jgi:hypothetical protein
MTFLRWAFFILWFAGVDLFGRWRSIRITLVNLGGVLALVAFALLVYGLVLGTDERRRKQFRDDPLATCLIVRPIQRGKAITAADVADLNESVRGRLPSGDRLLAVAPFYVFPRDWFAPGSDESPRFQGRTVAGNDPLFDSYRSPEQWLSGGPPAPGKTDLVVSAAMLERLGLRAEDGPAQLEVRTTTGKVPVALAGALRSELPGRHDFLIPEAVYLELHRKDFNPRVAEVCTGPLAPRWAVLKELPADVKRYLLDERTAWGGREDRGEEGKVWSFHDSAAQPPPLHDWRSRLEKIAQLMEPAFGKAAPGFTGPHPAGAIDEPRAPDGYHRIALYVRDLDDLAPANEVVQAKGYEPVDDRHEQILRIQRTTTRALALFSVVLLAVAALVAWNIYAIQSLQAQQNLPEVGMLKAMGMPGRALLAIYLCEAVLLWLPGTALGLLSGWGVGNVAEWWMSRDVPEATLAFTIPLRWLAVIIGGSLLLCLISTLWAMRQPIRSSPLECLTEP